MFGHFKKSASILTDQYSDWSITLPLNGILISYKVDIRALLKKFDPEPDPHPLNLKLSAYNNFKMPVLAILL